MKRIEVSGPVVYNHRTQEGVERFIFAPRREYEVPDAVASSSYLRQYLVKVLDVDEKPQVARRTRVRKEAAHADDA